MKKWNKKYSLSKSYHSNEFHHILTWCKTNCGKRGLEWDVSFYRNFINRYYNPTIRIEKITFFFDDQNIAELFKFVWLL